MSFDISETESELDETFVKQAQLIAAYMQRDALTAETKSIAPGYLKPFQAAIYLQTTECALRGYRARLEGPKFTRRGNNVRYKIADLDAWMDEARVVG